MWNYYSVYDMIGYNEKRGVIMKILFLGNSLTRHCMKTDIGWNGDYGMAASRPECDYVHVLCSMIENKGKHVIFKTENIGYFEAEPCEKNLKRACSFTDFAPDIVIIRIGENVRSENTDKFGKFLPELIRAYSLCPVFVVSSFWEQESIDEVEITAAEICGARFVSLSALRSTEYQAIGQFEHGGVAAHPSDKGMKAIAEIIYDAIEYAELLEAPVIHDFVDFADEKTDYAVSVDGKEVRCHACRVSAMPFNTVWPGHQRPIEQTEVSSFISFEMTKPVDVRVKLARRPFDIAIRPKSAGIEYDVFGDTLYFTIKKPGQYSVEIDGRHNNLHIFADKKRENGGENASYRFEHGVFDVGKLVLKSGESVYIGADAVVYGEISSVNSENVRIFGGGILDGSKMERSCGNCEIGGEGLLKFIRCKNLSVEGIILRDSCMWTATMINCESIDFDNVKVIGMWRYNSDGFDFVNSRRVHVSNCFLRTFDDGIVLKGLRLDDKKEVEKMNVEDHLIENCVVWCDWGGALEFGAETVADEYKNIRLINCDIIRTDQGALRIHSGDRADIHDVLYENINIEYSRFDTRAVYQENDEMKYEPGDVPAHDAFIKDWMYCGVWSNDNIPGHVHGVTYKNIRIYKDEEVPMPVILLNGADAEHTVSDITLSGVYLNGEKITPTVEKNEFIQNITIDGEII